LGLPIYIVVSFPFMSAVMEVVIEYLTWEVFMVGAL
jgi:hypothetical protein